jgi:peroxiredoxin
MAIQVGDSIPDANINILKDGVQAVSTGEFFKGRKVVLFAVPGAFTPTCSAKHLPGYIEHAEAFSAKGYAVACLSALVADDGKVTQLFIEAPGEFSVSSAESVLAAL